MLKLPFGFCEKLCNAEGPLDKNEVDRWPVKPGFGLSGAFRCGGAIDEPYSSAQSANE